MIPSAINSVYPKFVPNQVLTSDNLNELFGYLDEQQRITRTNLVGIGIVCGLEVKSGFDADGMFLTITKGCGVTSQGYLVTVPEIKYYYYNQFDAVKCKYYERFVNISAKTQKLPLWELKQKGETGDAENPFHNLNDPAGFLNNKVLVIFVELLETNNKNCDPNSCDDKGTMVSVYFRPLLVLKSDADTYLSDSTGKPISSFAVSLADLKMPRFDVAATLLLDTEDVFSAFQKILTSTFISTVKSALSDSWTALNPLFIDDYPADPFTGFESKFSFLNDGSIETFQALNLQYFYDFFSDLLLSYDELKKKTFDLVCECVPDESLFPRHLLLGEAVGFDEQASQYRTHFISSPVLSCCADDANTVRTLFKRIVLMIDNLSLMDSNLEDYRKNAALIKITPSVLGKEPLSDKAIPFYYQTNKGSQPLYLAWDWKRTERGTAQQLLSYKSFEYNTADDFVKYPLKFDLEPYNFLRIEGHVGQDYRSALAYIVNRKQSRRLPVDVIALSSDTRSIFNITGALSTMDTSGSIAAAFEILIKHSACFSDIFLALDEWINKLRCCLLENRRYFGRLPSFEQRTLSMEEKRAGNTGAASGEVISDDPEFTIEKLYEEKLKAGTINDKFCGDVFVDISTNKAHYASALVIMPYKIDSMISTLPEHITELDAKALEAKYADLNGSALQLRNLYTSKNVADTMTGVDLVQLSSRLEMNCLVCLFLELKLLVREFLIRLLALMIKQKLGFYAYKNPGIQHKAGVTFGGTFILVYHEASEARTIDSGKELLSALRKVNTKSGNPATGIFSGDQALLSSILLLEEFLFLQKVLAVKEDPNEVLGKIVETIKPGTVIADFYVPYLCCSDCPPAQMIVLPAPEAPNRPPVADAGEDQVVMLTPDHNFIELDGTKSADPDGDPLTFEWVLLDGPNTPSISNPDQAVTKVTDLVSGDYKFKLIVKDDKGVADSDTVGIAVKIEEIVKKTCGPLSDILIEFDKWNKLVKKNPSFTEIFKSYKDVVAYFRALTGIITAPVENQIEFFSQGYIGLSTQDLLMKWLNELQIIIRERKDFRLLALMLYRILNLLAMYIVCIQKEDFDKAKVPMIAVFDLITSHVGIWVEMIKHGEFSDEEASIVKDIANDIDTEMQRVDANGETAAKSLYVEFLRKILDMIKSAF